MLSRVRNRLNRTVKFFRLLKLYGSGLKASFKVIKNGYEPGIRTISDTKYPNLTESINSLFKETIRELSNYQAKSVSYNYKELIYFGHTKNNIKEFDFFFKLTSSSLNEFDKADVNNNFELFEKKGLFSKREKFYVMLALVMVCVFITARIKINVTTFNYAIEYTKNFIFYYLNFRKNKGIAPKIAILSNDHTPKYLAASKVLKFFGVYRIYLQHGGISNLFPKLDFELSILMNEKSKLIYQRNGEFLENQEILTISRTTFDDDLSLAKNSGVDIVIFPTSVFNIAGLERMLRSLEQQPNINTVYVQPHPRSEDLSSIVAEHRVIHSYKELVNEFFAITGNSSIAIELSLEKIPTFQCFELDDIEDDYYGFVKDGVTRELLIDDIVAGRPLERFVPDSSALRSYCPILSGTNDFDISRLNTIVSEMMINSRCHGVLDDDVMEILDRTSQKEQKLIRIISESYGNPQDCFDSLLKDGVISYEEMLMFSELS